MIRANTEASFYSGNIMATTKSLILSATALLTLLAHVGAHAQDQPSKIDLCFSPSEWVGKYPTGPTKTKQTSFFDLPCVRGYVMALLPSSEYRILLSDLRTDSQIEMIGRFLIVARCEAHNCPAHHAMVVVDTESADIVVGFYRKTPSNSRTTWYSRGPDPLQLPQEVLEQFLRHHVPR